MHDQRYDEARLAKLKELKRLMMELELAGEDGTLSPEALEGALAEAEDASPEGGDLAVEGEAMAEEEDPLAAKRRAFFKPKAPEPKKPGTAIMIALGGPAKSPAPKTVDQRSGTKGKVGGKY